MCVYTDLKDEVEGMVATHKRKKESLDELKSDLEHLDKLALSVTTDKLDKHLNNVLVLLGDISGN